jgi:small-conductance mechanosensitive channel
MDQPLSDSTRVAELFARVGEDFLQWLPQLVAGLAVLLAGWIVAHLLRVAASRLTAMLNPLLRRLRADDDGTQPLSPALIGGVVFWLVLMAFAAAAAGVLGLSVFSDWIDALLRMLPALLAAALIVVTGVIGASLLRSLVVRAARRLEYRVVLGYATQGLVLALAAVIALDLIGLDVSFLMLLVGVVLALAFGLGARTTVGNLLGARYLRRHVHLGDELRIGDIEGRVVELSVQDVVLETAEGRTVVPARWFSERPSTVLIREQDRG